eukprot:15461128-Alexandrium_andersonii.AAC.1
MPDLVTNAGPEGSTICAQHPNSCRLSVQLRLREAPCLPDGPRIDAYWRGHECRIPAVWKYTTSIPGRLASDS